MSVNGIVNGTPRAAPRRARTLRRRVESARPGSPPHPRPAGL